jgi:hypothetical protein
VVVHARVQRFARLAPIGTQALHLERMEGLEVDERRLEALGRLAGKRELAVRGRHGLRHAELPRGTQRAVERSDRPVVVALDTAGGAEARQRARGQRRVARAARRVDGARVVRGGSRRVAGLEGGVAVAQGDERGPGRGLRRRLRGIVDVAGGGCGRRPIRRLGARLGRRCGALDGEIGHPSHSRQPPPERLGSSPRRPP